MIILCFIGLAVGGALVTLCGEVVKDYLSDFFSKLHK